MESLAELPTYTAGIAQASANRLLKKFTEDCVTEHGITMMQWYILGALYEAGEQGFSVSQLAQLLDTTIPYITTSINLLESRGFVTRSASTQDSRVKRVHIKKDHIAMVQLIERDMRTKMRAVLYSDIEPDELLTYIKVLYKLNALLDASTE